MEPSGSPLEPQRKVLMARHSSGSVTSFAQRLQDPILITQERIRESLDWPSGGPAWFRMAGLASPAPKQNLLEDPEKCGFLDHLHS